MFVIVKVDITQDPGVSKFLTGAIKLLIATQMSPCAQKIKLLAKWYSRNHKKLINDSAVPAGTNGSTL